MEILTVETGTEVLIGPARAKIRPVAEQARGRPIRPAKLVDDRIVSEQLGFVTLEPQEACPQRQGAAENIDSKCSRANRSSSEIGQGYLRVDGSLGIQINDFISLGRVYAIERGAEAVVASMLQIHTDVLGDDRF